MQWWIRIRSLPLWLLPLVLGVLLLFLPSLGLSFNLSRQIQLTLILALVVSGLNLTLGFAGELGLGQAAMYAAGAYTAGIISKDGVSDILVQLLGGAVAALLIGVITGLPGLRLGGWSLAMTSFFLVLLIPDVVQMFTSTTGGPNGLSGILPPTLFGSTLDSTGIYETIVVVVIIWFAIFRNVVSSRHGVAFRVLKQSPVLASTLGISVYRMKLLAYALGAVPAGLAGALFANIDLYISPGSFDFTFVTTVLAASILGGAGSVYGAIIGAAILQFGVNQSNTFQQYSLLFSGALLIIGGVILTGGLAGLVRAGISRLDVRAGWATKVPDIGRVAPDQFKGRTLTLNNVSKAFGGNAALRGVSISALPGNVTAVIGPNGSGKTTLLNMVCGFYRTDSGEIDLDGKRIESLRPHNVARAGVARTFQTPNIPAGVSVLDVVISGRYTSSRASLLGAILRSPRFRYVRNSDRVEAERVLQLVGLGEHRDDVATSLPLGMRRMLEVARCLISQPGVLLLDEVASGLDEHEVERLDAVIRRVAAAGGTVVVVEHNFQLVLSIADDIVVLAHGEVIAHGAPSVIENDPRVLSEYLGIESEQLMHEAQTGERE